jgi:hypothetical protein
MFLLDSLMISGISWALRTVVAAAEAEMNDDSALREALLEAEMRREIGEISDDEFADIEADLLARIREIKERREGGSGPIAFGAEEPMETSADSRFQVEVSVSGDFHDPADTPHTTIVEHDPGHGLIVRADEREAIRVLDMVPGDADPVRPAALPLTAKTTRAPRARRARQAGTGSSKRKAGAAAPRRRGVTSSRSRVK